MSIFYSYVATANGPVCNIVDEFDSHKHYPIDCADIGTATMVATLPGQDWIDHALRRYFEYTLEQEAITNAELLEVELQDYYLMFPEYDPSLGSFVFNQDQYVLDNQPANDGEIQALLDLVRSIEELGV